jgi:hypothetical protein
MGQRRRCCLFHGLVSSCWARYSRGSDYRLATSELPIAEQSRSVFSGQTCFQAGLIDVVIILATIFTYPLLHRDRPTAPAPID